MLCHIPEMEDSDSEYKIQTKNGFAPMQLDLDTHVIKETMGQTPYQDMLIENQMAISA